MDSSRVLLSQPHFQAGVAGSHCTEENWQNQRWAEDVSQLVTSLLPLKDSSLPLLHWKWTYNACTGLRSLDSSLPFFFFCVFAFKGLNLPTNTQSQSVTCAVPRCGR